MPGPRGGAAPRSVRVTRACERELRWFMAVAAVARLLLPRFSIWQQGEEAGLLQGPCPRRTHCHLQPTAALPGAVSPDWAHPSR